MTAGPLTGLRVVELAGLGPAPHAAMLLADLGGEVVRVERPGTTTFAADPTLRGRRRTVVVDLKTDEGRRQVLDLARRSDVLVEGLRPGVVERLGIGPRDVAAVNPALVYGRVTGWGQDGPLATAPGHDLNYIGLTGALEAMGRDGEPPVPPLNLVGDFGGGSMLLVVGVLAALWERQRTGLGQVVDAAMVDGTALLSQLVLGLRGAGLWGGPRGANLLDGGAPFYATYTCADGRFVAVGAIEPQFYAELVAGLGLDADALPDRDDPARWPALRRVFEAVLATRSRDEWAARFDGTQACVTPVLTFEEAQAHPHLAARGTFVRRDGVVVAAPAPRFSRPEGVDPGPGRPER